MGRGDGGWAAGAWGLAPCPCALEGVYGDVQRVKVLFNKKENALVQMADGRNISFNCIENSLLF